jgi:hypothetical protein
LSDVDFGIPLNSISPDAISRSAKVVAARQSPYLLIANGAKNRAEILGKKTAQIMMPGPGGEECELGVAISAC